MKTLLDIVREHEPDKVNTKYTHGVFSCPQYYECLRGYEVENPQCSFFNCVKCWNRPAVKKRGLINKLFKRK